MATTSLDKIKLPDELTMDSRITVPIPDSVPLPSGWRILVRIAEPPEKIGNVFMPPAWAQGEKALAMTAQVLHKGSTCYMDPVRFPDRVHWCQPGDWVLISKYAGTRFLVRGFEYRVLNDDEIQAVFRCPDDVSEVKRA